ncbi:hypothetical protein K7G98_33030, partial [Saccharothrix sp. MB29]|nr:hypothetical protein [Saccharothrix sp. MB29]
AMEWRLNPPAAVRRLPQLGKAVAAGHLRDHTAAAAVENLLWYRGADEAEAALAGLHANLNHNDVRLRGALLSARALLESCFPPVLERLGELFPSWTTATDQPRMPVDASSSVIAAFGGLPWYGDRDGVAADAARVLRRTPLVEANLGAVFGGITTLVFADHPEEASSWLERLPDIPNPAWEGVRHALAAEVALRLGDPAGAESWAQEALRVLPVEAWGV